MKLIFEKSVPGRRCTILPACDVEIVSLPASLRRETKPALPEMSETDISRHYTELCKQVHGVNCGFYPLGSCTMKYNPRIDEEMAALPGMKSCDLVIGENGRAVLQADNGSVQVSRELTSAELSRLSVTLNDGSLSEEAKRLRVTGLLNTVILSEAASLNFEQGMAEQRGQTEILKR